MAQPFAPSAKPSKSKRMKSPTEILVSHLIETLPADIDHRLQLLNAAIEVLKTSTPRLLRTMLGDIDRHLDAQEELSLQLAVGNQPRGSSRLGDQPLKRGSVRLGDGRINR